MDEFLTSGDRKKIRQVQDALQNAGLQSCNLIFGVDFTKGNLTQGRTTFDGQSLHSLKTYLNPYEETMSIIGYALSRFNEENLITCLGFGDESARDKDVFSFFPDMASAKGFVQAIRRYREILKNVRFDGPTSFAPVIYAAMDLVEAKPKEFHVLVIIANSQAITSRVAALNTLKALTEASHLPLSIVLVGVGDGPWDTIRFIERAIIPQRRFDNFNFVTFGDTMEYSNSQSALAIAALMLLPEQFKITTQLNILKPLRSSPLPPPMKLDSEQTPQASAQQLPVPPSRAQTPEPEECPICYGARKDTAFDCGHRTCFTCSQKVSVCPLCRKTIKIRLRLF